jgi:hypothetical protein
VGVSVGVSVSVGVGVIVGVAVSVGVDVDVGGEVSVGGRGVGVSAGCVKVDMTGSAAVGALQAAMDKINIHMMDNPWACLFIAPL